MRVVVVALVLAVTATNARAEDDPLADDDLLADDELLAEARRLEASLDYNAALIIVDRTISQGGATPEQLVTLHLFAGKLAAGLDRAAIAEDHFARVLALAPTTTFPDGTSPKITAPFDAARAKSAPLRVTATVERTAIALVRAADPLGLVVGMTVKLADGSELREARALRVALAAGARATEVGALDAYGNRVWSEPVTVPSTRTPIDAPITLRPLYARWPFWAAATGIALTAGGICAWRFSSTQDAWNRGKTDGLPFSELQAIEDRGRRWGLAANLSFGVAAASTVVAIITAARGSTTTAVVTARPDSVGLAIAGGF